MRFRVLGPLEVEKDGKVLELGSRKQRTVLAFLVANAGSKVSVDQCLVAVWGDDASTGSVRSLHTYVSNLRSVIDPERQGVIEGLDGGYRLNISDTDRVDWIDFSAADENDPDEAASALDLWRGSPFQDVEDDWARSLITSWEDKRIACVLTWADDRVASGDAKAVVTRLEELVDDYPLNEPLTARLILALYVTGRQADALAVCKTLRERLVDELGIDPSPEIQELEDRILTQDPTLLPQPNTPTNVPAALSETIGRERELEQISSFLDRNRLLTITGAGGVGKTTAARDLARSRLDDFPDGVWWFELAPITDPSVVLNEMIGAMRLPPPQNEDAFDYLRRIVAGSRSLLVFDNCEHLIDTVARVVTAVLGSGKSVKVVATSREPLSVSGELTWALPPMSAPDADVSTAEALLETDAGALFAARARQAAPGFSVTDENAGRIASVCRRLDGLPFAIELAAARLRSMGLSELEGRLDDRFKILTGGNRTEVPHHRTLQSTVEWSYELLSPDAQTLYAEVSVFRGGFDLQAAESVTDLDGIVDPLDSLVASSLLITKTQGDTVRYRMLETVREHGGKLLEASGRRDSVRQAHLDWIGALVREGARHLEGEQSAHWASRFRNETANIRSALAYAAEHDPVTGAAICGGLSRYWFAYATDVDVTSLEDSVSFLDEGRRWSELMLEAELPPKIRGRLLTGLGGLLLIRMGRFEDAVEKVKEAQKIWEHLEDDRNLGWAVFYEATASWSQVPIDDTVAMFDRANTLHEQAEDRFGTLTSTFMRGLAKAARGDVEAAKPDFLPFISLADKDISPWAKGHAHDTASLLAILEGRHDGAVLDGARAAIGNFLSIPNYACLCHAIHTVGMHLAATGQLQDAARIVGVVQSIRDRLGMVLAPYEDRTFWMEDLGLNQLDQERRSELEAEGRALGTHAGIKWVESLVGADD